MQKSPHYELKGEDVYVDDFCPQDLYNSSVSSNMSDVFYFFLEYILVSLSASSSKKEKLLSWYEKYESQIPLSYGVGASLFLAVFTLTLQIPSQIIFDGSVLMLMVVVWLFTTLYSWHRNRCHYDALDVLTQDITLAPSTSIWSGVKDDSPSFKAHSLEFCSSHTHVLEQDVQCSGDNNLMKKETMAVPKASNKTLRAAHPALSRSSVVEVSRTTVTTTSAATATETTNVVQSKHLLPKTSVSYGNLTRNESFNDQLTPCAQELVHPDASERVTREPSVAQSLIVQNLDHLFKQFKTESFLSDEVQDAGVCVEKTHTDERDMDNVDTWEKKNPLCPDSVETNSMENGSVENGSVETSFMGPNFMETHFVEANLVTMENYVNEGRSDQMAFRSRTEPFLSSAVNDALYTTHLSALDVEHDTHHILQNSLCFPDCIPSSKEGLSAFIKWELTTLESLIKKNAIGGGNDSQSRSNCNSYGGSDNVLLHDTYSNDMDFIQRLLNLTVKTLTNLDLSSNSLDEHVEDHQDIVERKAMLWNFLHAFARMISERIRIPAWPQTTLQFPMVSLETALSLCGIAQQWIESIPAVPDSAPESVVETQECLASRDRLDDLRIIFSCVDSDKLNRISAKTFIHGYLKLQLYHEALDLYCSMFTRLLTWDIYFSLQVITRFLAPEVPKSCSDTLFDFLGAQIYWESAKGDQNALEGKDGEYNENFSNYEAILEHRHVPLLNLFPSEVYKKFFRRLVECQRVTSTLYFFHYIKNIVSLKSVQLNIDFFTAYTSSPHVEFCRIVEFLNVTNLNVIPSQILAEGLNSVLYVPLTSKDMNAAWTIVDHMETYKVEIESRSVVIMIKNLKPATCTYSKMRIFKIIDKHEIATDIRYFSILVNALARLKDTERLKNILALVSNHSIPPNPYTMGTFIKACGRCGEIDRGWNLWCKMLQSKQVKPTSYTYGCILDMLVSNNIVDGAILLLRNASHFGIKANTVQYSIVIKGCAQQKMLKEALELYWEMESLNIPCNGVTYNSLINTSIASGNSYAAQSIVCDMLSKSQFQPDVITYSTLIKGFCDQGYLDQALDILSIMDANKVDPDVVTFNILLEASSRYGEANMVHNILQTMLQRGVAPSSFTLTILIKHWGKMKQLSRALELASELPRRFHFQCDAYVYTALIAACITCNDIPQGLKFFVELNTSPYKQSISGRTFGTVCFGCLKCNCVLATYAFVYEAMARRLELHRHVINRTCAALQNALEFQKRMPTHQMTSQPVGPNFFAKAIVWLQHTRFAPPPPLSLSTLQHIFAELNIPASSLEHLFTATLSQKSPVFLSKLKNKKRRRSQPNSNRSSAY